MAARALLRLGRLTKQAKYRTAAGQTLDAFQGFMARMPQGTSTMLEAAAMYLDTAPAPPAGKKPDAVATTKPVAVAAFLSSRTAAPGSEIDLSLRVIVDEGWHVSSLSVKADGPVVLGEVVYPPGKTVKFAFSADAMTVYEGTIWLRTKLALAKTVKPGRTADDLPIEFFSGKMGGGKDDVIVAAQIGFNVCASIEREKMMDAAAQKASTAAA